MCDRAFLGDTPEERAEAHQQLLPCLFAIGLRRQGDPRDDLISSLVTHEVDGRRLPLDEALLNLDNILVGGVRTVRHTSSTAMLALTRHPDAWEAMREDGYDPELGVEELLRWTSVGLHVLRTARTDTELAGRRVRAGERVVVWTPAANRDETEFEEPDRLRLDRTPNRHLALGWGPTTASAPRWPGWSWPRSSACCPRRPNASRCCGRRSPTAPSSTSGSTPSTCGCTPARGAADAPVPGRGCLPAHPGSPLPGLRCGGELRSCLASVTIGKGVSWAKACFRRGSVW